MERAERATARGGQTPWDARPPRARTDLGRHPRPFTPALPLHHPFPSLGRISGPPLRIPRQILSPLPHCATPPPRNKRTSRRRIVSENRVGVRRTQGNNTLFSARVWPTGQGFASSALEVLSNMKMNIQVAVTLLAALHVATARPEPPVPGQNAYLPPTTGGYHYSKPPTSFTYPTQTPTHIYTTPPTYTTPPIYNPTTRPPIYTPPPPPPPSYGPPITTTRRPYTTTRPTYRPTPPTYYPTTPRPDYGVPDGNRPSYEKPSYGPPTATTPGHTDGHHHHHEPGMPFDFNYAVRESDPYGGLNDYSHNAISNGDVVNGEYRVLLPDGRVQVVKYTADWATGYHAQVSYEGGNNNPFAPNNPQY
ncbi:hypothetical protein J437_LFUL015214 [Ladona fulva]|uniref:Pro-resilin n=1 Tax=Ladona fulva TaxID=123851 RepID=A0A8K0P950_LADFU|nr:hypothetical protein J437_LFUL015214 [Ladona fulva]